MFVSAGARQALLKDERQRFLTEVWPKVYATMQRLGLSPAELHSKTCPPPSEPWPSTQDRTMTTQIIKAHALGKSYRRLRALDRRRL